MKKYLDTKEASEYLNIPVHTVRYQTKTGNIKGTKFGVSWLYTKEDLDAVDGLVNRKNKDKNK